MRVAFFGTSGFAVPSLRRLVRAGHAVGPIVTAPPRPSGRGRRIEPNPVELAAAELGLPVLAPDSPDDDAFLDGLRRAAPAIAALVAYGFILKQPLLDLPRLGFLNVHPSLLPAYRGAAPIQRALMDGVAETGVSVMAMSRRVDSGDIVSQERVAVGPDETAGELTRRLAETGARLLDAAVAAIAEDRLGRTPQEESLATPAPKISKNDRPLDWTEPAARLHNRVRALSPEPGATTSIRGRQLVILRTRRAPGTSPAPAGTLLPITPPPGTGDPDGVLVATGSGLLELLELKPAGKRPMPARAFVNGLRPEPGEKLQ